MEKLSKKKVPTDWRSRLKRMSFAILMIFLFFSAVFYWLSMGLMSIYFLDDWGDDYGYYDDWDLDGWDCEYWVCSPYRYCAGGESIGIVTLYGELDTYSHDDWFVSSDVIMMHLNTLEKDADIETVILLIDSYGGYMVPAEEIANTLKSSGKQTVAVIREAGLSGAYLAATGADTIYASRLSSVGSLGVTMSYLDHSEQRREEGVRYLDISSGRFKDAGDPDRPLDEEEREYLFGIVQDSHEIMVKMIAENRGISEADVRRVSDGRMMLGGEALEHGLIDGIGGLREVIEELGKTAEDACEMYYPYSY